MDHLRHRFHRRNAAGPGPDPTEKTTACHRRLPGAGCPILLAYRILPLHQWPHQPDRVPEPDDWRQFQHPRRRRTVRETVLRRSSGAAESAEGLLPEYPLHRCFPAENIEQHMYISSYFYLLTLWLVKAAFIQFYFEIFPYIKKWLRVALWITTVWTVSGFIIVFFMMLFWCHPRSLSWYLCPHPPRPSCWRC